MGWRCVVGVTERRGDGDEGGISGGVGSGYPDNHSIKGEFKFDTSASSNQILF